MSTRDNNNNNNTTTVVTNRSNNKNKRNANEISTIEEKTATTTETTGDDVAVESTKTIEIPRGRNVSGRDWKPVQRDRKSSLFKGNRSLRTFSERQQLRTERDALRAMTNELKAEAEAERAAEGAKRAEKRRRKEENIAKNTVYQTITNVHKIRKMTAKQARLIRKVQ
jgi:hypothetical protein